MAENGTDYVLTRDIVDNSRLNLQHYLWIEIFGYHINPAVGVEDLASPRIADVGTGTAVWLTDLARRPPSTAALDSLDVSFDAVPPVQSLPSNVTLHHYDIYSQTPAELRGVYDIVHVRNMTFVVKDDQAESAIRNVMQLLKPGGYLQWAETDVSSFRIERTTPGPDSITNNPLDVSGLTELMTLTASMDSRMRPTWVPTMPKLFERCGLTEFQADVKDAPPYMALAKHECNLVTQELIARKTRNMAVAERLTQILPQVIQETRAGAFRAFTRWTVVGKKAA
ncbi:hypothetical protein BJY04DRAFT_231183 [Aspergillus karnatakaensis]|uniref:class I SAM-dependent methyltransferase n=1 Tax=Aspergillus karnatakaensis TaxID=1810916 RepID=UPI003CCE2B2E